MVRFLTWPFVASISCVSGYTRYHAIPTVPTYETTTKDMSHYEIPVIDDIVPLREEVVNEIVLNDFVVDDSTSSSSSNNNPPENLLRPDVLLLSIIQQLLIVSGLPFAQELLDQQDHLLDYAEHPDKLRQGFELNLPSYFDLNIDWSELTKVIDYGVWPENDDMLELVNLKLIVPKQIRSWTGESSSLELSFQCAPQTINDPSDFNVDLEMSFSTDILDSYGDFRLFQQDMAGIKDILYNSPIEFKTIYDNRKNFWLTSYNENLDRELIIKSRCSILAGKAALKIHEDELFSASIENEVILGELPYFSSVNQNDRSENEELAKELANYCGAIDDWSLETEVDQEFFDRITEGAKFSIQSVQKNFVIVKKPDLIRNLTMHEDIAYHMPILVRSSVEIKTVTTEDSTLFIPTIEDIETMNESVEYLKGCPEKIPLMNPYALKTNLDLQFDIVSENSRNGKFVDPVLEEGWRCHVPKSASEVTESSNYDMCRLSFDYTETVTHNGIDLSSKSYRWELNTFTPQNMDENPERLSWELYNLSDGNHTAPIKGELVIESEDETFTVYPIVNDDLHHVRYYYSARNLSLSQFGNAKYDKLGDRIVLPTFKRLTENVVPELKTSLDGLMKSFSHDTWYYAITYSQEESKGECEYRYNSNYYYNSYYSHRYIWQCDRRTNLLALLVYIDYLVEATFDQISDDFLEILEVSKFGIYFRDYYSMSDYNMNYDETNSFRNKIEDNFIIELKLVWNEIAVYIDSYRGRAIAYYKPFEGLLKNLMYNLGAHMYRPLNDYQQRMIQNFLADLNRALSTETKRKIRRALIRGFRSNGRTIGRF